MKIMSRTEQIINSMNPNLQKQIRFMRQKYSILMELGKKQIISLQARAVWLNYLDGSGRLLDTEMHYRKVPDGKEGYSVMETKFKTF